MVGSEAMKGCHEVIRAVTTCCIHFDGPVVLVYGHQAPTFDDCAAQLFPIALDLNGPSKSKDTLLNGGHG